jgi:hypothetical protein
LWVEEETLEKDWLKTVPASRDREGGSGQADLTGNELLPQTRERGKEADQGRCGFR